MWEFDHKECWTLKSWCFPTGVLEKTLEIPLDNKEIKPVNSEGNQPRIFIRRTMLKLKLQYSKVKMKVTVAQSCLTLRSHGLYSPWNPPGQNTGVGSLSLLQSIFPTQGWNQSLLHCRWILYHYQESPPIFWGPDKPTHWKRPQFWERSEARVEGDNRGWDGWMSPLIQWTGVWANSGI